MEKIISIKTTAILFLLIFSNCTNHQNQNDGLNIKKDSTGLTTSNDRSAKSLPEDSICIPVFAIWTDKASGGKYDGLYDSITSLFKYCKADKMQRVQFNEVAIDELNKCSKPGQMTPMMVVIKINHNPQFCNILAFDSSTNKLLLKSAANDTVIASMHKFSTLQKEKVKISLFNDNPNLIQMKSVMPILKNDNTQRKKFVIHKSVTQ